MPSSWFGFPYTDQTNCNAFTHTYPFPSFTFDFNHAISTTAFLLNLSDSEVKVEALYFFPNVFTLFDWVWRFENGVENLIGNSNVKTCCHVCLAAVIFAQCKAIRAVLNQCEFNRIAKSIAFFPTEQKVSNRLRTLFRPIREIQTKGNAFHAKWG